MAEADKDLIEVLREAFGPDEEEHEELVLCKHNQPKDTCPWCDTGYPEPKNWR